MRSLLLVLALGTAALAGSDEDRHLLDSRFPGSLQYTNPRFQPPPTFPSPSTPPVKMRPIEGVKIAPVTIKPIAPIAPMNLIKIRPYQKMAAFRPMDPIKPMDPITIRPIDPVKIRPIQKMKPMKPMKPIGPLSPMTHGKGIKPPPGLGPGPGEMRPLPRKMQAPKMPPMKPKLPGVGHETGGLNGFGDGGVGGAFRGF